MENADALCRDAQSTEFVRQLVEENYDMLYKAALFRMGGDIDAADSCLQQMLEIALGKADVVKAHKKPVAWLVKTLQNCIRKYRSKAAKPGLVFVALEEIEYLLQVAPPELEEYDDESLNAVKEQVLSALTEDEMLLYNMHYGEGLTVKEIAEKVGASVPSVKCRLYRIRLKVSELVKQKIPY